MAGACLMDCGCISPLYRLGSLPISKKKENSLHHSAELPVWWRRCPTVSLALSSLHSLLSPMLKNYSMRVPKLHTDKDLWGGPFGLKDRSLRQHRLDMNQQRIKAYIYGSKWLLLVIYRFNNCSCKHHSFLFMNLLKWMRMTFLAYISEVLYLPQKK